jgi:hypothetical protein
LDHFRPKVLFLEKQKNARVVRPVEIRELKTTKVLVGNTINGIDSGFLMVSETSLQKKKYNNVVVGTSISV